MSRAGVFEDVTYELSDFSNSEASTLELSANDYIYLATEAPFNSRYFQFVTPNATPVSLEVEIFNGEQWFSAIDLMDTTNGFTRDGFVRFGLDIFGNGETWSKQDSKDVLNVPQEVQIFASYWMRLKVASTLDLSTALDYVGLKFIEDEDLYSIYPMLRNNGLRNAWKTGKTTWNEQHLVAADHILMKLRDMGVVGTRSGFSIMDVQYLREAAIHKAAEIIWSGLGNYDEKAKEAHKKFTDAMGTKYFNSDINGDGQLSRHERSTAIGFMKR